MGFWGKLAGIGAMVGGGVMMATGVGAPAGAMLIGAGAGLTKKEFSDDPQKERDIELASQTARYSPWTRLNPQNVPIHPSDAFGSTLQGGMTGLAVGQGIQSMQAANAANAAAAAGQEANAAQIRPTFGSDLSQPIAPTNTMSGTPWRIQTGSWWDKLKPEDLASYQPPRSTYGF